MALAVHRGNTTLILNYYFRPNSRLCLFLPLSLCLLLLFLTESVLILTNIPIICFLEYLSRVNESIVIHQYDRLFLSLALCHFLFSKDGRRGQLS
jgi:hypothetical protein